MFKPRLCPNVAEVGAGVFSVLEKRKNLKNFCAFQNPKKAFPQWKT